MRNVAICGSHIPRMNPLNLSIETVEMEGVPVIAGLIRTADATFAADTPENRRQVLVRTRAFSCNYRDKALILAMATRGAPAGFYVVGSEFMGEVVVVGEEVRDLQVGDRVIPNGQWPGRDGVRGGLPTNHASREYQSFHPAHLLKIPAEMSDTVAAAFTIGAQTSYSMIRRLALPPGSNVLVTAAKSNTSLFVIQALRRHPVNVYATTTSPRYAAELRALGVKEVVEIEPTLAHFGEHARLRQLTKETGGFDAVIDPLFDIHLGKVMSILTIGGRYITCGFYDQHGALTGQTFSPQGSALRAVMEAAMLKNISLIGNCLGTTEDLQAALRDYAAGTLTVQIDSVIEEGQVGTFLRRTYTDPTRFGKVVYRYE